MYYRISLSTGKEHLINVAPQYVKRLDELLLNGERTLITMDKVIGEDQVVALKVWNDYIVSIEEVAICPSV